MLTYCGEDYILPQCAEKSENPTIITRDVIAMMKTLMDPLKHTERIFTDNACTSVKLEENLYHNVDITFASTIQYLWLY